MRVYFKTTKPTLRINSKILIRTCSDFELATLCSDEGDDLTPYEHLSKVPKFRPTGRLYVPFGLDKRPDDFSGKLLVYDYDNDKRVVHNFRHWLSIQKQSRFKKDPVNSNLVKYLPKLLPHEFIEMVSWVYPYFFLRYPCNEKPSINGSD